MLLVAVAVHVIVLRIMEELADILEVVCALAENLGASKEELLAACEKKHQARGGFRDRIFLISTEE